MDTTSDMQTMETIELLSAIRKSYRAESIARELDNIISYARYLNKNKDASVGKMLPGTEFLHGMLKEKIIHNDLYQQLVRLAEDSIMEYNIIIK